jgi:hypothetical protein
VSAQDHFTEPVRVARQVDSRAGGDRERAGADRNVGRGNTDDINQQRHGEDRAAAADQSERKPDQAAGAQR